MQKILQSLELHPQELKSPFMLLHGHIVRFTDLLFTNKSSGGTVHVVKDPNGVFKLLELSVDRDCDGTFYNLSYLDPANFDTGEYDLNEDFSFDGSYLMYFFSRYSPDIH